LSDLRKQLCHAFADAERHRARDEASDRKSSVSLRRLQAAVLRAPSTAVVDALVNQIT
jgi:hypothetical protein